MKEIDLIPLSELLLDVAQKLVHVRKLQYLLVSDYKHQFKLVVQLIKEEEFRGFMTTSADNCYPTCW